MKSLIILVLASIFSFKVFAAQNSSPIMHSVNHYVLDFKDFENDNYIQFSVNDLIKKIANDNPEISFFRDYDLASSYSFLPLFDGSLDAVVNMGVAIVGSDQGSASSALEFHPGVGPNTKWFERHDVTSTAAQLLTPQSYIRIALNQIPRTSFSISLSFKLWDMSNAAGLNLYKPQSVIDGNVDSPFSMDTQVVYFKLPWADILESSSPTVNVRANANPSDSE